MKKITYEIQYEYLCNNRTIEDVVYIYGMTDYITDSIQNILCILAESKKFVLVKRIMKMQDNWNDEEDVSIDNLENYFQNKFKDCIT